MRSPTVKTACDAFLSNIEKSMPLNTWKNYRSDLIGENGLVMSLHPDIKPNSPIDLLTEEHGAKFIQLLLDNGSSPATRQRKSSTLREFIRFIDDCYGLNISVDKLTYKLKSRHLLKGTKSIVEYPAEKIQRVMDFTLSITPRTLEEHRDLAFIWILAETGLRISEACSLKSGQINKQERITFIGKGKVLRTVKIGRNSRSFIKSYLQARKDLDASTGRPFDVLPLFARHDQTSGKQKVKFINPKVGEKIIHNMVLLALGDEYDPKITAHKFRHYYISCVMKAKGMKAAQIGAGHKRISTTDGYGHLNADEIDNINTDVFG